MVLFKREFLITVWDAALIVATFQYAITGILILIRWSVGRFGNQFDGLVYFGAAVGLIRQAQQTYLQTEGWDPLVKLALLIAILGVAVVVILMLRRHADNVLALAAWVCPLFGTVFLYEIATHPIQYHREASAPRVTADGAPVVLILLDELSLEMLLDAEGGIDAARFPNFDRISRKGIWYRQAITNYPITTWSVPSMLTQRYDIGPATAEGIDIDDIEKLPADNLLRGLAADGYRIVTYSNIIGCSGRRYSCNGYLSGDSPWFLARVFVKFVEEFGPDFVVDGYLPQITGARLRHEIDFLERAASELEKGTFYFVHLMWSHSPYVFHRDGRFLYTHKNRMVAGADYGAALGNYAEQLAYLDHFMGRFLSRLEQSPRGSQAIVALVSDHGNCWTNDCPGRVYPEQIRVVEPSLVRIPVMIFGPGIAPRVDDEDFQLVDVPATLRDALGMPDRYGTRYDGVSRLDRPPPPRQRPFYLIPRETPVNLELPVVRVPVGRFSVPNEDRGSN